MDLESIHVNFYFTGSILLSYLFACRRCLLLVIVCHGLGGISYFDGT
jgi:hypothetical protein